MSFLPDAQNCGLRMHRECRKLILYHRELAIPTCITARAWRTCRDVCRDRYLAVAFEVGGGEIVPGIPGACTTRNFPYLVRAPGCNIILRYIQGQYHPPNAYSHQTNIKIYRGWQFNNSKWKRRWVALWKTTVTELLIVARFVIILLHNTHKHTLFLCYVL